MIIETYPFATAVNEEDLTGKSVVVIDVLRATSVMITALENGAKEIIPVITVKGALQVAKKFKPDSYLLCGERNAVKIDGFDFGNSPLEFSREVVAGKTLIMTTTNGTKALNACRKAKEVYIAGFLNANAVVKKIRDKSEIVLLCSGTNGKFSLDDGLCAGMIMDKLSENGHAVTDDLGHILLKTWQSSKGSLDQTLKNCYHLNVLVENGFEKDVDYCLQKNTHLIVPVYKPDKGNIHV
ncbi:MAG: 2-phosphosulfolactate phosphatase [Chlorobi bacterium]|nr:2-phosphosulfolactate phosphatase [Chlorobiota bacterium]